MSAQLSQLLGTIAAIIGFAAACCIPAAVGLLIVRQFGRERVRPFTPRDEAPDEFANGLSFFFHHGEESKP